eukprot:5359746-Amphidinium_carterae.1
MQATIQPTLARVEPPDAAICTARGASSGWSPATTFALFFKGVQGRPEGVIVEVLAARVHSHMSLRIKTAPFSTYL